jgi:hypothetical protein
MLEQNWTRFSHCKAAGDLGINNEQRWCTTSAFPRPWFASLLLASLPSLQCPRHSLHVSLTARIALYTPHLPLWASLSHHLTISPLPLQTLMRRSAQRRLLAKGKRLSRWVLGIPCARVKLTVSLPQWTVTTSATDSTWRYIESVGQTDISLGYPAITPGTRVRGVNDQSEDYIYFNIIDAETEGDNYL